MATPQDNMNPTVPSFRTQADPSDRNVRTFERDGNPGRFEMRADIPAGSGHAHHREVTPIGLGAGAPSAAGPSTVTFTLDQPVNNARLIISDPGGIVISLTQLTVDGDTKYTGTSLATSAIEDSREGVQGLWVGYAENKITVTVAVTAAGSWMPYLVGETRETCGG